MSKGSNFFKRPSDLLKLIFENLSKVKDVITLVVFLLIVAAFFLPSVRSWLGLFIATNYGLKAYAYYEVDKNEQLSPKDGRFILLRVGGHKFGDLEPGDRLLAADGVWLRTKVPDEGTEPDDASRIMPISGQCVVILERIRPSQPPKPESPKFKESVLAKGGSGGWLRVATAPCELFDKPKPFG